VAKFISNDEIEAIKATIPQSQKLSHIKVKNGELVKVYFIEYIKD
jgi:translation initiation factor IF-1